MRWDTSLQWTWVKYCLLMYIMYIPWTLWSNHFQFYFPTSLRGILANKAHRFVTTLQSALLWKFTHGQDLINWLFELFTQFIFYILCLMLSSDIVPQTLHNTVIRYQNFLKETNKQTKKTKVTQSEAWKLSWTIKLVRKGERLENWKTEKLCCISWRFARFFQHESLKVLILLLQTSFL